MIDNSSIVKLFIRVPNNVDFNGATVSGASGNEKKIYFDEHDNTIWNNGKQFSLSFDQRTALATLIGSDTDKSVRTIATEVINGVIGTGDDATEVIDRLKEVLDWFHNLPESDAGALSLVESVGHPAIYYTAEEAATYNAALTGAVKEGDLKPGEGEGGATYTAEEAATYNATLEGAKSTSDVKTAATGLHAQVANAIAGGLVKAKKAEGELLVDAAAINNEAVISSTTKLQNAVGAAETSLQSISIAGVTATISGDPNAKSAEITKVNLQGALFTNPYENNPLSYSYVGVTVSLKESNGQLTYLNVDASELANRVTTLEVFDPWETYSAP